MDSQKENACEQAKKQPQLTPEMEARKWQPGQSGNPSGRPKKKPITEMFEQMLEKQEDAAEIREAIRKVFFQKSGIAKIMLLEKMAERLEGKVTQPVELNGELALSISERMRKARERNSGS